MLRVGFLLSVLVTVACGPAALGDTPFNVDFFCGWGGCYRPMEWTPIEIGISAKLTEAFDGSVTISSPQDGLNTMNITHEFVLTPDLPLYLPLVTKLAFAADKCSVRIVDKKQGKTRWHHEFDLWDFSTKNRVLTPVCENELLIGTVGSRKFNLSVLSEQSVCISVQGRGRVHLADKLPRMVPWDWTGFAALDLLILYNPEWTLLNRHQLNAIVQWVSNGGKLLLVLGTHPLSPDNPISDLIPFVPAQPRQLTLTGETLEKWRLRADQLETVTCRPLGPKPAARLYRMETGPEQLCFFGTGYVGFGRVGVLSFDPSELSESHKANAGQFWVGIMAAVLDDARMAGQRQKEPATSRAVFQEDPRQNSTCALTTDLTHPDSQDGGIEMKLEGLAPGRYRLVSWHNNPFTQHANIDILISGELKGQNIPQSFQRAADKDSTRAVTEFTVADENGVAVEFRPVDSSTLNRRAALCGFELFTLPSSGDAQATLRVDFGAAGQTVAAGFVGLGLPASAREKEVKFTAAAQNLSPSADEPANVHITLRATNPQDTLQFNPTISPRVTPPGVIPSGVIPPVRQRPLRTAGPSTVRTIEFVKDAAGALDNRPNDNWYNIGAAQGHTNVIINFLYNIAEMRPLSIWWVIFLLTALAVLLGPVDYLVLKRKDRLPLTWLTCSFWIVVFTVGAYYGVQAVRGGKMQLRAVSLLDGIDNTDCVWSSSYIGLFAPTSDDYSLEGLQKNQWWSAIAPSDESIWAQQAHGRTRNVYCLQHDGSNLPYSLPINIWTMQCLLNESPQEQLPLQANLSRTGKEVRLEIINSSDCQIKSGYVLFGDNQSMDFGTVEPHETRQFSGNAAADPRRARWSDERFDSHFRPGSHQDRSFDNKDVFFAQGSLSRTRTIRDYLTHGAAIVCAEYDSFPVPVDVKGRSCNYTHIQLVRLLIFPQDIGQSQQPADTER